MTRRRKQVLIAISVTVGLVVAVAAGARAAAPGWIRRVIERKTGEAIGRELTIAGGLDLALSLTPRLIASDVTLANAPWGTEPAMIRAGRITLAVDLVSLWEGPVRVRELALDDVRVLLEKTSDGRANWSFETKPRGAPSGPTTRPAVVVDRASIRGFELIYRPPREEPALSVRIDTLEATLDSVTRMVDIHGAGGFNDAPWDVAGRIGPLEQIYEGRDLDQALTGHIGRAALSLQGRIRDPRTLGGPNVEFGVDGPDIVAALATIGLRSPLAGPFRLHGTLAPQGEEVAVDLTATAGGATGAARGTIDAILSPERIDAVVEARGPDASEVGAWTGVAGLPPLPFDIAGRVRCEVSRLFFDELKLHVGGTSLTVGGTLGELPRCVGIDLSVAATGSDLAQLSALTRLRLPSGPFDLRGRFMKRADGLAIDAVTLRVREAEIHATGTIGQPPGLANLDLTADGAGPDASWLSGIATIELPAEPFEIRGRVARSGPALDLDGIAGRLGADAFEVDAHLVPVRGLAGTDAHVKWTGTDLAKTASPAGVHGLPAQPFAVAGRVRVAAEGYELEGVEAQVGSLTAEAEGRVAAPSALDGTSLACRIRGSALSDLAVWGVPVKLPAEPFQASGRLEMEHGVYRVHDAVATIGAERFVVDGTLGALPDLSALEITADASGPDLSAIGRYFTTAGAAPPARLPAEPFTVTGRLRRLSAGFELQDVKAGVGQATLSAGGLLGTADRGVGTDVTFVAEAPDTAMVSGIVGTGLPEGALRAHGRLLRTEEGVRLEGTEVAIGASFAQVSGLVGAPPKFAGTDLELSMEGPDLAAVLDPWIGQIPVPADSFEVSAHLQGSTEQFTTDRLTARLGDNDLTGSLSMRLEGRPFIEADLQSKHLDVPRLLSGFAREPEVEVAAPTAAPVKTSHKKREHLIPDHPLALGGLARFDGRLRLAATEVLLPGLPVRDVDIAGDLRNGALSIDRSVGTGRNGGRMSTSLSLRPDGDGYRLHAEGKLDGGRLDVTKTGESPGLAPSLDIEYEVNGAGRSLHEIAAGADGRVLVVLGPGRIPNTIFGGESSATLISLMDALNPFRKSSPFTSMECGVAAAGIDDGKMAVQPIAARTDKLTILGNGKVDFGSEAIDLTWTIKPRRNVGLSPGSIANPYIKLGGTLASPRMDVKPLEAVASTGAAVATAGLTIFLRGIYNRITAEKKVCVQALAKAKKQKEARAARKGADGSE